ncbi:MAG: 8-amino-7-oxononanoate synthase [Nitrospirae bacterium]|nr:8-amino-7-oxononanoate synthase [Nitrospirota bacterium]
MKSLLEFNNMFEKELLDIKNKGLYRRLRIVESEQSSKVIIDGKEVILLSSNNYLGLANHPKIKEAAKEAIDKYGAGSGAARLISGNSVLYKELEEKLAEFKNTEAALVFGSGYLANIGILSTVVGEGDLILSDELNHASIIDGCRLSRAEKIIYRHKDTRHIEDVLSKNKGRRSLIVTEGVFSMDGDIAPLLKIIDIAKRYSAMLMVDDAHGTGVLGKRGKGTAEHFGIGKGIDIHMGTLGKALGAYGAYAAGDKGLIELLINKARGFIFTTALPSSVLASAIKAIEILEEEPHLIKKLWENRDYLVNGLKVIGFNTMGCETAIIPILIGSAEKALKMSEDLFDEGIYVPAIRPPTVPENTCRLRLTVMAAHTKNDLDIALKAFEKVGKRLNII